MEIGHDLIPFVCFATSIQERFVHILPPVSISNLNLN